MKSRDLPAQLTLPGFGAIAAFLVAAIQALASVVYLLLPANLRVGAPGAQLLPAYHRDPGLLSLEFILLALVGVIGLAVIPAVSALVGSRENGLLRWAATLATVGYAVSAVSHLVEAARLPKIADAYVAGDASTKAVLAPIWRSSLDLYSLWQFTAVGIWIVVASALALRNQRFRWLAYFGLVVGVLYCLTPISVIQLNSALLNTLVAVLGIGLATIWYVWMGLELWRAARQGVQAQTNRR
ncbi:MAG TPA: DUF4386 family protein [Ktedonobacterales bacterium]|jgi:hypothetical protein